MTVDPGVLVRQAGDGMHKAEGQESSQLPAIGIAVGAVDPHPQALVERADGERHGGDPLSRRPWRWRGRGLVRVNAGASEGQHRRRESRPAQSGLQRSTH